TWATAKRASPPPCSPYSAKPPLQSRNNDRLLSPLPILGEGAGGEGTQKRGPASTGPKWNGNGKGTTVHGTAIALRVGRATPALDDRGMRWVRRMHRLRRLRRRGRCRRSRGFRRRGWRRWGRRL